jgi:predicted ATPase
MTVEAIRLQQFMAFEDTGWLDLRPITLLFGRNSSGKSAIIRALLLLKQSLKANSETGPLVFYDKDGFVDQDGFETTVHRKWAEVPEDTTVHERTMVFGFRCCLDSNTAEELDVKRALQDYAPSDMTCVDVYIGFRSVRERIDQRTVSHVAPVSLRFYPSKRDSGLELDAEEPLFAQEVWYEADSVNPEEDINHDDEVFGRLSKLTGGRPYRLVPTWEQNPNLLGFWPVLAAPQGHDSIPFEENTPLIFKLIDVTYEHVKTFLENIVHLGALRPSPQRVYLLDRQARAESSYKGLNGWRQFLSDNVGGTTIVSLELWLKALELGASVAIDIHTGRKHDGIADMLTGVYISEQSTKPKGEIVETGLNLKDMGSGAAQVLPVLIEALTARSESLVIIEQPELHLHPEAQAVLADFFVDMVARGIRFLIETHSEHFLLRWQRRIAETSLEKRHPDTVKMRNDNHELVPNQVCVHFVQRLNSDSSVEGVHFDGVGRNFTVAQDGSQQESSPSFTHFFSTDYKDARFLGRAMSELLSNTSRQL